MESWPILPEAPLEPAGDCSRAFLVRGCPSYRSAAEYLHGLPYGRNSDRSDPRRVLSEGRGTCSTKHALLASLAIEQGLPVSLSVGIYEMSEANTPGVASVLHPRGLASLPEAHCYLRYADRRVDITRSGVRAREPIRGFHREWPIAPSQIGAHKERLHRDYLREWLRAHPEIGLSLEELWRIREACIAALAGG